MPGDKPIPSTTYRGGKGGHNGRTGAARKIRETKYQDIHQRIGSPHRGQGIGPQIPAHNQGIRYITALLQQILQDHRNRKSCFLNK